MTAMRKASGAPQPHPAKVMKNVINTNAEAHRIIERMFRAYQRLGELYDMNPALGRRYNTEQDLVIRSLLAARIQNLLSGEEFAKTKAEYQRRYNLQYFDNYIYICFPRRRGKSFALACVVALFLATNYNMKILIINLSAKLARQNAQYVLDVLKMLSDDPDHVIRFSYKTIEEDIVCKPADRPDAINVAKVVPNPDKSPTVRPRAPQLPTFIKSYPI
jgi:hypothetical protein